MDEPETHPLEVILRVCAEAAPEPWYPSTHAEAAGVPRAVLDPYLDRLRLAGLVRLTDWVQGHGQGYALTPEGAQVLQTPRLLRRLRDGQVPVRAEAQRPAGAGSGLESRTRSDEVVRVLQGTDPPTLTWILMAINVLVFLAGLTLALWLGVSPGAYLAGKSTAVLRLEGALSGGDFYLRHQWWRLLTSAFVHIGWIHLAMNMVGLYLVGPALERVWGHGRFLTLYLVSGLGGGCGMLLDHPTASGAGASGAWWGLLGAMVVWIYLHREVLPGPVKSQWQSQLAMLLGLNLVVTFTVSGISRGGHFGGGIAGLLVALPLDYLRFGPGRRRWLALVGVMAVPFICLVLVRQAWQGWQGARVRERQAQVEFSEWGKRYYADVAGAALNARDVYYRRAEPLLEQGPSWRPPARVQQVKQALHAARDQLNGVRDELHQAGPSSSSVIRRLEETSEECLEAWNGLLEAAEQLLSLERADATREAAGLERLRNQKERVQEAEKRWIENFTRE